MTHCPVLGRVPGAPCRAPTEWSTHRVKHPTGSRTQKLEPLGLTAAGDDGGREDGCRERTEGACPTRWGEGGLGRAKGKGHGEADRAAGPGQPESPGRDWKGAGAAGGGTEAPKAVASGAENISLDLSLLFEGPSLCCGW